MISFTSQVRESTQICHFRQEQLLNNRSQLKPLLFRKLNSHIYAMKKQLLTSLFLVPAFAFAQEKTADFYIQEVTAKINSPSVEQIDLEKGKDHFTAYYFNDQLIALKTSETGEMANKTTKEYFLRNDSLISFKVKKCFTSQEILDLDMYIAGNTDSKTGKTDWSKLPSDCMEMNVSCIEKRFTKSVSGKDIFDQPEEISIMCAKEEQIVREMLEALNSETASQ